MKFYYLLLFISISSCNTSKIILKTGIEEISFGSGGGFTGEIKTYKLTSNSKLFEKEKEIKKIETKNTLALFKEAKELIDVEFTEPENMYSFIEINSKGTKNRIVWAFGSTSVDQKVIKLYQNLNNLITNTKQLKNAK